MDRANNRKCFYKYATADTAEAILEKQTLKWSAPNIFNDPFDHSVS